MLRFHCEHCGRPLGAKESYLGRTVKCLGCGQMIVVRDESTDGEPASSQEPAAWAGSMHVPQPRQLPPAAQLPQPRQVSQPAVQLPQPRQVSRPAVQLPQPQPEQPAKAKGDVTAADFTDTDDLLTNALASAQPRAAGAAIAAPARRSAKSAPPIGWYAAIGGGILILAVAGYFIFRPKTRAPEVADNTLSTPDVSQPTRQPADDGDLRQQESAGLKMPAVWPPPPTAPRTPPAGTPLSPEALFAEASPAVGRVDHLDKAGQRIAFGSGFFVSADGLLITNYHVIDGAADAKIVMANQQEYEVEGVAAVDRAGDLVLLKAKASGVPFLKLWDGDPPRVGSPVFAIGNPEGMSNTLSNGLVSGLRENGYGDVSMVQINAAISHGSSGGPLLIASGLVVGVTSAGLVGGQNINFALPSRQAVHLLSQKRELRSMADLALAQGAAEERQTIDQAMALVNSGEPAAAITALERIAKDRRENWRFWFAMGFAHWAMKNPDQAETDFANARRLQPDASTPWLIMGSVYLQQSKADLAAECFTRAIALDAGAPGGYAGLARAQLKLGKAAEAVATCKRGLDIFPGMPQLLLVLGGCEAAAGNQADARAAFDKVLEPASGANEREQQLARDGLRTLKAPH